MKINKRPTIKKVQETLDYFSKELIDIANKYKDESSPLLCLKDSEHIYIYLYYALNHNKNSSFFCREFISLSNKFRDVFSKELKIHQYLNSKYGYARVFIGDFLSKNLNKYKNRLYHVTFYTLLKNHRTRFLTLREFKKSPVSDIIGILKEQYENKKRFPKYYKKCFLYKNSYRDKYIFNFSNPDYKDSDPDFFSLSYDVVDFDRSILGRKVIEYIKNN